jgi:hypothetical protein
MHVTHHLKAILQRFEEFEKKRNYLFTAIEISQAKSISIIHTIRYSIQSCSGDKGQDVELLTKQGTK